MLELKLNQTVSNIKEAIFELLNNKEIVYTIKSNNLAVAPTKFEIFENEKKKYSLAYTNEDLKAIITSVKHPLNVFTLYDKEKKEIGKFYRKKSKLFFGYYFFVLEYHDKIYKMYEVGMGKEGIKLPIYSEDEQVALIEKNIVTIDNKDTYNVKISNKNIIDVSLIMGLYYDSLRFGHRGEVSKDKTNYNYLISINKELISKYDKNWGK